MIPLLDRSRAPSSPCSVQFLQGEADRFIRRVPIDIDEEIIFPNLGPIGARLDFGHIDILDVFGQHIHIIEVRGQNAGILSENLLSKLWKISSYGT
jgi:hypothetical protein